MDHILVALLLIGLLLVGTLPVGAAEGSELAPLRPPAVPLVACDPYFSIWSCADKLTDDWPRHWTGKPQALCSLIRVDGRAYRLMGAGPEAVPALPQVSLQVQPTRSIYDFQSPEVHVTLTFMTAGLPDNLELLARPVTYLTWEVRSADGKPHAVSLYYDNTAEPVINTPDQKVVWSRERVPGLEVLRMGSKDQPILAKKGDDLRIDWGYLYVAAPQEKGLRQALASQAVTRGAFAGGGALPTTDDTRMPRAANDDWPVAACQFDLGTVEARGIARHVILAYDDIYSIEFFKARLRGYWRRPHPTALPPGPLPYREGETADGRAAGELLKAAERDYVGLAKRCRAFDDELMADLRRVGGERYARFCALAYRQCLAAMKVGADANGQPLLFPKENFSNGCVSTVDVIYPMEPFFLLFSPTLTKASLAPVLEYASSDRWPFPFAPHDLGTYPKPGGQAYGSGSDEGSMMPVEESGNMLILLAALAHVEGNADFAARYWDTITKWAEYLKAKGLDPANQLCTDDFAGHLAHNANLSIKAILGLRAYAALCEMRHQRATAARYRELAEADAAKWVQMADDGDHFQLAFDKPGTWSQKYNLVWDRILGYNLFPASVAQREMVFYRKTMNRYGLPLDNRQTWAKVDWTTWTATLTGDRADFEALFAPMYDFLGATKNRVPITDLYWTKDAKQVGMQARPVIGGVFIKLLYDADTWRKWAGRDKTPLGEWAALPKPPQVSFVVPSAQQESLTWRYTLDKPADGWEKPGFDDAAWKQGPAGFGAPGTPGAVVRTEWHSPDIWIRREFTLQKGDYSEARLWMHHDEDVEVTINGVFATSLSGYTTDYEIDEITPEARATLKAGVNTIAAHCHQTTGGQYIDMGIVRVKER